MTAIYLHPLDATRYRVTLGTPDGEVVAERTRSPEYAAIRTLVGRGLTGELRTYGPTPNRPGAWTHRLTYKDITAT